MTFSSELLQQIKYHEGFMSIVYEDSTGHMTIGYGHKLLDNEYQKFKAGIDIYTAESLLKEDLAEIVMDLTDKEPWIQQLSSVRRDTLYNMAYNMGAAGLLKFKKMIEHVKNQEWTEAAVEMKNSLWCTQVRRRCQDLAHQMISDEYVLVD